MPKFEFNGEVTLNVSITVEADDWDEALRKTDVKPYTAWTVHNDDLNIESATQVDTGQTRLVDYMAGGFAK